MVERRTRREANGAVDSPDASVIYNEVLVTPTRGQHPDSGSMAKGYVGRDLDELDPAVIIHRKSDGTVSIKHREAKAQGTLVVLVLGAFEPGFATYRPWSELEQGALDEVLADLKESGVLADDAPVYTDYGIPGTPRPAPPADAA